MTNKEILLEQMFANKWLNELTDNEVEHLLDMLATSRSFGYAECQKEYEEKLRWIPISECLPDPLNQNKIIVKLSKIDTRYGLNNPYTEIRFASVNCHGQFILSIMNNYEAKYITEWRYFLL